MIVRKVIRLGNQQPSILNDKGSETKRGIIYLDIYFDKDKCDVAHKKARKSGGKYTESNLLYLCPNCHRLYDKGKLKI